MALFLLQVMRMKVLMKQCEEDSKKCRTSYEVDAIETYFLPNNFVVKETKKFTTVIVKEKIGSKGRTKTSRKFNFSVKYVLKRFIY